MIHFHKVSVITIVRNDAEGFLITAKSVISQEYNNIEWIVVDGLSTDNTSEYVKQLSPEMANYIIEPDNGIYNAMNKGIDMATGEWIFFMNADDVFFDRYSISNYMKDVRKDDDILYADAVRREDGNIHSYRPEAEHWAGMFLDHQTACVRASIYKMYKFDESLRLAGDLNFFSKAKSNGYSFRKIEGFKACIKPFQTGISADYVERQSERIKVLKRYYDSPKLISTLLNEYSEARKNNSINEKQYNHLLSIMEQS